MEEIELSVMMHTPGQEIVEREIENVTQRVEMILSP